MINLNETGRFPVATEARHKAGFAAGCSIEKPLPFPNLDFRQNTCVYFWLPSSVTSV